MQHQLQVRGKAVTGKYRGERLLPANLIRFGMDMLTTNFALVRTAKSPVLISLNASEVQ
jgi:hypothetical protein